MSRNSLWVLVAFVASCGGPVKQIEAPPESPADKPEPELRAHLPGQLAAFDYVWQTIRDKHWDPKRVGSDWEAARAELRPKVAAAKTSDEARAVIRELLARLGQSHFQLMGGSSSEGGPAGIAADVRIFGDELIISRLHQGADKQLRAGMVITAVDGKKVVDRIVEVRAKNPSANPFVLHSEVAVLLTGRNGGEATLEVTSPDGAAKTIKVKRTLPTGNIARYGNVTTLVEYESRMLGKDVGYIRLSAFFDPSRILKAYRSDIGKFSKSKGIVFDLRGNPGGLGAMASGMAGYLLTQTATLGTTIGRDSRIDDIANPQPGAYGGNVAVVIDELCASTCEIFAAGLAEIGRAKVFGTTSAGAALPSQIEQLPTGDLFQYAVANYVTASGKALEGKGVTPTVEVLLDKKALWDGTDPQLDAARAWVANKKE